MLRGWAFRWRSGCTSRQARTRCGNAWPSSGGLTRTLLADVPGWRVVEPVDEPTAITTLAPTDGADPVQVRAWLIAEHGIVTTAAGSERAPLEMTTPVLRVSPHIDAYTEDIEAFVTALRAVT